MHQRLAELHDMIADGDTEDAILSALDFVSGPAEEPGRHGNRFREYRKDLISHAADLKRLVRRRRRGVDAEDRLDRQERDQRFRLLDLIDEIDRAVGRADAPAPVEPRAMDVEMPAEGIPEKIVGRDNLQDIAWLEHGIAASRAVCRVKAPGGVGTGFLVAGWFVITNNHIVPDADAAGQSTVEFNFERDEEGRMKPSTLYRVARDPFATVPAPEDISVLTVIDDRDQPLKGWGVLEPGTGNPPPAGAPVTIIQHPSGGDKKIALTDNEVIQLKETALLYRTDTRPGSSGAPVFDEHWRVVALHRAGGIHTRDLSGAKLFANQGVLMSHLLALPEVAAVLNG